MHTSGTRTVESRKHPVYELHVAASFIVVVLYNDSLVSHQYICSFVPLPELVKDFKNIHKPALDDHHSAADVYKIR
jgi:hypothetical protein